MVIKIKLDPGAVMPTKGTPGSAGYDFYAIDNGELLRPGKRKYRTGVRMEIPEGYVGLIFPRSSIHKTTLRLSNSVGVIDSDYRGEISFIFDEAKIAQRLYQEGDRIGQVLIIKNEEIGFQQVEELSDSARGEGGFGHTGR